MLVVIAVVVVVVAAVGAQVSTVYNNNLYKMRVSFATQGLRRWNSACFPGQGEDAMRFSGGRWEICVPSLRSSIQEGKGNWHKPTRRRKAVEHRYCTVVDRCPSGNTTVYVSMYPRATRGTRQFTNQYKVCPLRAQALQTWPSLLVSLHTLTHRYRPSHRMSFSILHSPSPLVRKSPSSCMHLRLALLCHGKRSSMWFLAAASSWWTHSRPLQPIEWPTWAHGQNSPSRSCRVVDPHRPSLDGWVRTATWNQKL